MDTVSFEPTKQLFIDVLTKDISIHDCVLDLADNSVDSYVWHKLSQRRTIQLGFGKDEFHVYDDCGGIPAKKVREEVFRFGFSDLKARRSTIGFYGIGLKRAVFKIAREIRFETDDGNKYTRVDINVHDWAEKEHEWTWPLHPSSGKSKLKKAEKPYTKIVMSDLTDEAKETFDVAFINDLKETIGIYYTRFIQNKITFMVDKEKIGPFDLGIKYSKEYPPANHIEEYEGVKIHITCWIQPWEGRRTEKERGRQGWNIFMNDRLVIHDDASPKTGWSGDEGQLPKMHSIFNQFRGLVLLESKDPSKLPINTLKNDFHTENVVYKHLLSEMIHAARPLVNFLSKKYGRADEIEAKAVQTAMGSEGQSEIETVSIDKLTKNRDFKVTSTPKANDGLVMIRYWKPKEQVELVKNYLKITKNPDVGVKTFDYFVKVEGLENEK